MFDVNSYKLINKCSPFILFDSIRNVGGETTMTTKSARAIEATKLLQERQPDTQQQMERNVDIKQAAITRLKV